MTKELDAQQQQNDEITKRISGTKVPEVLTYVEQKAKAQTLEKDIEVGHIRWLLLFHVLTVLLAHSSQGGDCRHAAAACTDGCACCLTRVGRLRVRLVSAVHRRTEQAQFNIAADA